MKRRDVVKGIGAALAAPALIGRAAAETAAQFPTKPITLIMPWGPGTGIDLWHRAMAEVAGKILGQPVIVDNKTGASGTLGPSTMAATAKPDGYTISHIPITIYRLPFMRKVAWDPITDFSYIIHQSGFLFGVTVKSDSPFKSFKDMIDFARAHPGKVNYGSPGAGTSLHIGMELIAKHAGIEWTHVPFIKDSEIALLGGHIMANTGGASWWPHTDAGNMRVLTIWTENRNMRLPDVPTLRELGYPFVFDSPFGLAGPKGMDPGIVRKLHDAFQEAQAHPKAKDIQTRYDYVDRHMGPEAYKTFVAEQVAEQKAQVEKLGLATKN